MPRHKKITDSFTIENFLFVLSEFSKLFLMRLNIHTHSVVMTTNTSKTTGVILIPVPTYYICHTMTASANFPLSFDVLQHNKLR